MFDIIAIGSAARDITFLTDQGKVMETPEDLTAQRLLAFEYGAKIRSEKVWMNFGGGACNSAATLANMGLNVAIISRIGADGNGKSILDNLQNRNIDTTMIQIDREHNSAFSFIVVDSANGDGERVIFSHKGAVNYLNVRREDLEDTEWIYLTSLSEDWKNNLEKISDIVAKRGVKLVWNPGEAQIASGKVGLLPFLLRTYLLIINKDEAIELVKSDSQAGFDDNDYNDIYKLISIIRSWGVQNVVITDGKNGACFSSERELLKSSAFAKAQADTTGAGDAFGSGLVAGYIISGNWETALKFGVLNSGGEVAEYGAQRGIMTREEIENNLSNIEIEKVNLT